MQALLMVQTNRKCIDSNKTLHLEFTTFQCTASAASIHLLSHWDILLWFLLLFRSLMTLLLTELFFPSRRCWLFSFPKLMLAWYIRMIINYQFHEVECVFLVIWSHTLSNDLKISIHFHGGFQSWKKMGSMSGLSYVFPIKFLLLLGCCNGSRSQKRITDFLVDIKCVSSMKTTKELYFPFETTTHEMRFYYRELVLLKSVKVSQ